MTLYLRLMEDERTAKFYRNNSERNHIEDVQVKPIEFTLIHQLAGSSF